MKFTVHIIHFLLSNLAAFAILPPADDASAEVAWSPPVSVQHRPAPATPSETAPGQHEGKSTVAVEKPHKRARGHHAGVGDCKRNKKSCQRGKEQPAEVPSLDDVTIGMARVQRARVLELAQPQADAGRTDDAARIVASAADLYKDPVLYLAAAEFDLSDPHADQRRLVRADHMARTARKLLVSPVGLRVAADEVPRLNKGTYELSSYARSRQERLAALRRGKAELACGSTFLAAGVAGAGILLTGAVMSARVQAARDVYTGQDASYLAILDDTGGRAKALIAAGAAATIVGAVIGIPLTITGVQQRRRGHKGAQESPSFRVVPSVTSVSITGRF